MRATTLRTLLLACLLSACGGAQDDSDAMTDDGAGIMEDSSQMEDAMGSGAMGSGAMGSGAMGEPAMEEDSTVEGMMDDGSTMARDTSEMQRP